MVHVVSGHQPAYLPWLGLFHKMALADTFVLMDDVQYLKEDWINRNRVKNSHGAFWLTVPVRRKESNSDKINDIIVDDTGWGTRRHWQIEHWRSISSCYGNAPYWDAYAGFLENFYTARPWRRLVDINLTLMDFFANSLGIAPRFVRGSEQNFRGQKSDLVLEHCTRFNGNLCVLGTHGRDYIVERDFFARGINIYFQDYQHPQYQQRFGDFAPHLSIIDLLFNCGPRSRDIVLQGNMSKEALTAAVQASAEPRRIEEPSIHASHS